MMCQARLDVQQDQYAKPGAAASMQEEWFSSNYMQIQPLLVTTNFVVSMHSHFENAIAPRIGSSMRSESDLI